VVGCISLFPSPQVLPGMVIRHQAFEGVAKRCLSEEAHSVRTFSLGEQAEPAIFTGRAPPSVTKGKSEFVTHAKPADSHRYMEEFWALVRNRTEQEWNKQ
jgi:hypothetical protein